MAARFSSVEGVALEFFDEFAEFGRETVHGTLEARQEVERHDDGEADRRDGRQEILFHLASSSQMAGALAGRGWRWDRKRKEWQGGVVKAFGMAGVRRVPVRLPCARWLSGRPWAGRL